MTTKTVETILERVLLGHELSVPDGVMLLQQTDREAIAAIRNTADRLRIEQVGETVTYVINRNINFTNICEQHCSFCAFRRDAGEDGSYWLELGQILEKVSDAVGIGATEICIQGGLNPEAKLNGKSLSYYQRLIESIKEKLVKQWGCKVSDYKTKKIVNGIISWE